MASSKKIQEDPKLLETVQMFEVITAANPDDYQSYEILKEAYGKLGREREAIDASKKIAKIYVRLGQISHAILEYEGILQNSPDDAEALAALGDLESKMPGYAAVAEPEPEPEPEPLPLEEAEQEEDSNLVLVDFMVQHGLFAEKHKPSILSALSSKIAEASAGMPPPCVLDVLAERAICPVENAILFLAQTTKIPFMPMDSYDIDLRCAEQADRDLCVGRLVLPFDQISRTVFAATVNPLDRRSRQKIEASVRYRVQWYVAKPNDIRLKIKEAFRLVA